MNFLLGIELMFETNIQNMTDLYIDIVLVLTTLSLKYTLSNLCQNRAYCNVFSNMIAFAVPLIILTTFVAQCRIANFVFTCSIIQRYLFMRYSVVFQRFTVQPDSGD